MHCFKRVPLAAALGTLFLSASVLADANPQPLPFAQDWSNTSLITANDDWSGVPGIVGYLGDGLTGATGTNPQTLLAFGSGVIDVIANQTNPGISNGGVAEFELADPTIALNGSGTADAPFILLHLNTAGWQSIQVGYLLRDLDGSADNAVQPVALQYRIGNSGDFTNVPAAFVADATSGPSLATQTTPVSVTLPAAADNQPLLQLRVITSNAVGNDEWVGIDSISVTGSPAGGTVNQPIQTACPASVSLMAGAAGSVPLAASDADSIVNHAAISAGAQAGIALGAFNAATQDGETASVPLEVSGLAAGSYPVEITFGNNEAQTAACTVTLNVAGITPIPAIQGAGSVSPLAGQRVVTEGVVTRVNNNGFFMQDETGDGDVTTSDGIFVFTSSAPAVSVGERVRLSASVEERNTGAAGNATTAANPVTQLSSVSDLTVLAGGIAIPPTPIAFPEAFEGELERYEGMLVEIAMPLTASQNYFLGRYGQVTLAAEGRLHKPTNLYRPGSAEALALAADNARRRIILDDGSSLQNPSPIPYIGEDNTLRAGDTLPGLTGVIDYGLATSSANGIADYRIHPTAPVVFSRANARSTSPAAVGGKVRVASFNVLNYFTTLDQTGAACSPSMTRSDCRGADSAAEFVRQRDKIVAALAAINADAVGLIEIENNGETAVKNLVEALNAVMGTGTYTSVGLPAGGTGTDAIRMAMIYQPARLSPVGSAVSDTDAIHNRPPLAQTFAAANGEKFTLVVNHFKSKGSCPADSSDVNADQGDGQGCWNALRVQQAQALRDFVTDLQARAGDDDVLVMGDLNAYGREAPVTELLDNGYIDQISRFNAEGYSYVFDGEAGYLDHALATASLSGQIAGATEWHINADEPSVIDYNTEFKPQDLYAATPYRASDHDPVVVGLSLLKKLAGTSRRDVIVGTAGDSVTDFVPGTDRIDLAGLLASLANGSADAAAFRPLVMLQGLTVMQIDPVRDLGL